MAHEDFQIAPSKPLPQCEGYSDILRRVSFWRDSYEAGPDYRNTRDACGDDVLWRFNKEEIQGLEQRRKRVIVEPEVRPAVDKYVSFCLRQHPARQSGLAWYDQWLKDADGNGNSFDAIKEEVLRWSFVDMKSYFYVYTNAQNNVVNQTDEVSSFVQQIDRIQVPWSFEKAGIVHAAVVILSHNYAVYYTRDFWQPLRLKKSRGVNTSFTIESVGEREPNNFGAVPLVPFDPHLKMVSDLSEAQKFIFNLQSLANQNTFGTVNNLLAFTNQTEGSDQGGDPEDDGEVEIGPNAAIFTSGDVKYVAPSPAVLDMIAKRIDQIRSQVSAITGLGGVAPNTVESGLAKRFRFDELNTRILNILSSLERAERTVTKLVATGIGVDIPEPVRYPDDVGVPDIESEYARTKDMLDDDSIPNVIKKEEVKQLASLYDFSEDDKRVLMREIDALYGNEIELAESDTTGIEPVVEE